MLVSGIYRDYFAKLQVAADFHIAIRALAFYCTLCNVKAKNLGLSISAGIKEHGRNTRCNMRRHVNHLIGEVALPTSLAAAHM